MRRRTTGAFWRFCPSLRLGLCAALAACSAAAAAEARDIRSAWLVAHGLRAEVVATDRGAVLTWRQLVVDPQSSAPRAWSDPSIEATLDGASLEAERLSTFPASGQGYAIGIVAAAGPAPWDASSTGAFDALFRVQSPSPLVRWLVVSEAGGTEWLDTADEARAQLAAALSAAPAGDADASAAATTGEAPAPAAGTTDDAEAPLAETADEANALLAAAIDALLEGAAMRRALLVPAPLLVEANRPVLDVAYENGIALYPVTVQEAGIANGFAELVANTGGRALRWLGRDVSEAEAFGALAELLSGHIATYVFEGHYRLPGEEASTLRVAFERGGESAALSVAVPARRASWSELLSPASWATWLASPGRRAYGIGAFAAAALLLAVVGLAARRLARGPRRPRVVLRLEATGESVAVWRLPFLIGRSGEVDLSIADDSVSRSHARLVDADGELGIVDLDSKNGTFVEGARVQRAQLRPGQAVTLGAVRIRVQDPTS